jgi:hypothetical protein
MAAAFAVAFMTPMVATSLFPDGIPQGTVVADCLRNVLHQVLNPGPALGPDRARQGRLAT